MNNNYNQNYTKQLPDVFKELKEAQKMHAIENLQETQKGKNHKKTKINDFNMFDTYQEDVQVFNHKFNAIGVIIGVLFLLLFTTTLNSNAIFAKTEEEKEVIGEFEINNDPINLMEIVSENISEIIKKEITTEQIVIEKEIEYIENNQLPKDEQVIIEAGINGKKELTYIRSYENDQLIDEKIISERLILEPSKSIIQVGTSEFLANKKVHIGDTMYTVEDTPLMTEPKDNSIQICNIYQYIDVKLEEVKNGWCKVTVDGLEGYVKDSFLTSITITPDIVEKSRIKRIMLGVYPEMELNQPSGLTRTDFIKILSNNEKDVNKIFEENAGLFYDIEQKYNINGIFLASIGIHESNWGTSAIAREKKNLFGYGAYDSSPYESSYIFESYQYGIELLAKVLTKYYINAPGTAIYEGETALGSYFNGATVAGVNTRYASDTNWSNRVFEIMKSLYEKL